MYVSVHVCMNRNKNAKNYFHFIMADEALMFLMLSPRNRKFVWGSEIKNDSFTFAATLIYKSRLQ